MKQDLSIDDKISAIFKVINEWDTLSDRHMAEFWSHEEDHHYNVANREQAQALVYASCSGQLKALLNLWGLPQPVI